MKKVVEIEVPDSLFADAVTLHNLIDGFYGKAIEMEDEDGVKHTLIKVPYVALDELSSHFGEDRL